MKLTGAKVLFLSPNLRMQLRSATRPRNSTMGYLSFCYCCFGPPRDFTVIVVSDRSDLTNELYSGFVNQVSARAPLATIVSENQQLTETLLAENKSIVFTTLQRLKYIRAGKTFTNKNTLLIGYNLHSHIDGVRDILTDATFILFTSVAVGINSRDSEHFGRLISKYDFRRA